MIVFPSHFAGERTDIPLSLLSPKLILSIKSSITHNVQENQLHLEKKKKSIKERPIYKHLVLE